MTTTPFPTAITELFGTRLPIVAGGMMWLANTDYVAAASRAGIIGFITAASFPEPDALRAEIRRCCRELCDGGPFAAGHAVAFVDKVEPLAAIVARLEQQMLLALARLRPHAGAATATARGNLP